MLYISINQVLLVNIGQFILYLVEGPLPIFSHIPRFSIDCISFWAVIFDGLFSKNSIYSALLKTFSFECKLKNYSMRSFNVNLLDLLNILKVVRLLELVHSGNFLPNAFILLDIRVIPRPVFSISPAM